AIEHASSEVKDLWDDGKLKELSGIGEGIASSLDELFSAGRVKHFEEILAPFPEALFELMEIPGIGPKNALKFCKAFGITKAHTAVSKLEKAAKKGEIAKLEGFGEDSQTRILQGITELSGRSKRILLDQAHTIVDSLIFYMQKSPHVKKIDYLGSLRRQASTVGDLDFSVATNHPKEVIDHFCKYPNKSRILEAGDKSASLILPGDHQADLMVQPPEAYGSLLQHFTGSKHHNIALRELALKKGYSLSEHGIRPIPSHPEQSEGSSKPYDDPNLIRISTEEKFYEFLGLDWIPPELREGRGEIEAARSHTLPKLLELSDIKGDLQLHSNFPIEPSHDLGRNSPEEIASVAKSLGYEYIGLTDHNPAISGHTESQIIDLVKKRSEAIRSTRASVHIFVGLEIDIQPDGKLALPEAAFAYLDYACVSIHSSF
ncbi:MAG: helix-hairpin-helix domain-containing protein, partial [Patescibacteria group bacterium]